jgi:hypothetical protein
MRFHRVLSIALTMLLVVSSAPLWAAAQGVEIPTDAKTVNVELIIDASGSMADALPDGELRIDAAKRVLHEVVDSLPERAGINVGLRVYGHLGDNTETGKAESCSSSELFVPIEGIDRNALHDEVDAVQPTGWTPIAYSLERAAADFDAGGESITNAIVLVTDGEETCAAPEEACSAAAALQSAGIDVTTHVVGLSLSASQSAQVSCIAQEGGGQLFDADDAEELGGAIDSVLVDLEILPTTPKTSAAIPLEQIRTLAVHEITAWDDRINEGYGGQGEQAPLISDDGSTIIFGRLADPDDPEARTRVFAMNPDGGDERQIDAYTSYCYCNSNIDVSANGEVVAITDSVQIRVASSSGGDGQEIFALESNEINGMRITGDGRTIVFRVYRDTSVRGSSAAEPISRGVYAIDPDGSNLRRLVGPEEMAPRLNVTPELVPFFGGSWGLDVSFDGNVIAFASFIAPESGGSGQGLFVTDGDGGTPRMLLSRTAYITNGAVSSDGSTIAYISYNSATGVEELGVIAPNGFGQRKLSDNTLIGMGMPSGERIQLSADGTRLLLGSNALLFDTTTGAKIALSVYDRMSVGGDPPTLLIGTTYRSSMTSDADQIIFFAADEVNIQQLVRLDVNPADLGDAPVVTDPSLTPTFVQTATGSSATAAVHVETSNAFLRVGIAVLRDGMADINVSAAYNGPLADDGVSIGDTAAGDGIFTTDKLTTDCCAIEGPRIVRFRAETVDAAGLRHATTVDVRPFAVGSEAPPAVEETPVTPVATEVPEPIAAPTEEPEATEEAAGPIDLDAWAGQPDPSGCETEGLSGEAFVTSLANAIDSPPDFTVPQTVASVDDLPVGGPVDDDADALAALETLHEAGACINAGDLAALLALFTPVGLARAAIVTFGGVGVAQPIDEARQAEIITALEPIFANPTPPTSDAERATIDRILEIRQIEDGRIMIVMEGTSPIVGGTAAFFLKEQDGRWLIDETCAIGDDSTIQPPSA